MSMTSTSAETYELLDFGQGRKLERFGPWILDRPAPAAEDAFRQRAELWSEAHARFTGSIGKGEWTSPAELPPTWNVAYGGVHFELKFSPTGHIGLFPEQAENWDWLRGQFAQHQQAGHRAPQLLNLFAYTGGSTLAAAAAGAEVVHLDSARNTIAWARRNAALSGCEELPIRWIVEDAAKFVRREAKRGNKYDGIILDPPSYGHGPRGQVWRAEKHLPWLLEDCAKILSDTPCLVLLTCHTPSLHRERLLELVRETFAETLPDHWHGTNLALSGTSGAQLPSGVAIAWSPYAATSGE